MARTDERMAAFDAVMWGVEDDPVLRSVIVVVALLDRAPDVQTGVDRVERMTLAVPKLRQRVIGNPLSLVPPRWENDPNFDLDYHLRWYRTPQPEAGLRAVLQVAEKMAEQDFDRNRPLWEMTLVTGLSEGRAALIVKIHHSITDGVGGMVMAASLFDFQRDAQPDLGDKPAAPAGENLGLVDRVRDGLDFETGSLLDQGRGLVTGAVSLAGRTLSDPGGTASEATAFAASAARLLAPAGTPMSALMAGRSLSVRLAILEAPLDRLKEAGRKNGGTLNDAFFAAVTGGLGRYHERHGRPTDRLRVNMPVNLRPKGGSIDPEGGNAWIPARFLVPIDEHDAAVRIKTLHPILLQARSEPALPISGVVFKRLTELPRPVTTAIAGGLMKGTDFAATNVPGPPMPVYLAGAEVLRLVPFAPKAGAAVNIALMTYNGVAQFGINIDVGAVPDPDVLLEDLQAGIDEVLALAPPPPPPAEPEPEAEVPERGVRAAARRAAAQVAHTALATTGAAVAVAVDMATVPEPDAGPSPRTRPAAKKTAAKKTAAKKTPAKKTPAKKTAAKKRG